jgi:hypothetical protein
MVSATVACLPAAVSLLLLEALFMQISGVSLALTLAFHFVLHFCFILFSEVFHIMGHFLFNIVNFHP